jgi:hypothetical protein
MLFYVMQRGVQSQPAYCAIGLPAARPMPCEEPREEKRQSRCHHDVSPAFACRTQGWALGAAPYYIRESPDMTCGFFLTDHMYFFGCSRHY